MINSYFFRLPKLWNSLRIIDLSESIALINFKVKNYFWEHLINNFDSDNFVLTIFFAHVSDVPKYQPLQTILFIKLVPFCTRCNCI